MKLNQLPRWLKSQPIQSQFTEDQIDVENGIIRNVVLCEVGPAKGHGVHLEEEFIVELVAYGQKHHQESGQKARFGHPAFSETTMGRQLGRYFNIQQRENRGIQQAIGDLHLLDAANESPSMPGMKDWVLSMAKEAPDFMMSSIVFVPSHYYQRDSDGNKVIMEGYDWCMQWDNYDPELGEVYVGFGEDGAWHYTDMVEAGAATNNLFSQNFNQDKFAIQAITFIQEHPALHEFIKSNPEKIAEFCTNIGVELPKPTYSFKDKMGAFSKLFFSDESEDPTIAIQKEFDTEKGKWDKEKKDLQTAFEKKKKAFEDQIAQLKADNKELSERIPEKPTDLNKGQKKGRQDEKAMSSATQKAMEYYKRKKAQDKDNAED